MEESNNIFKMGCCTSSVRNREPMKVKRLPPNPANDGIVPPNSILVVNNALARNHPRVEENKQQVNRIGLRVVSNNQANEDEKEPESQAPQHRIYCGECGIGIATQEEFLNHLFTCRAQAVQTNINNQIIAKANTEDASKYEIDKKRIWFRENLTKLRVSILEDSITLVLSRENVLEETMNQFSTVDNLDLHKDIKIFFIDEEARDVGGVIREWISIVTLEILKPETKIFEMVTNNEETFYTIHPEATYEMCHFAGQIFGKAIFEGAPLDGRLSKLLLMKLLLKEPTLDDLKLYDEQLYTSISFLFNEGVDAADLCMNFTIMDNGKTVALKDGGEEIDLTNENKDEYALLVVEYYTYKRAETQTVAFIESFMNVIPHEVISIFEVDELDQVFFGLKEIDIQDWKENTFYKGEYLENNDHKTVKWFWEIVENLNNDEKRKFLQFCTGSRSLPIEGFKGLKGQRKQN